MLPGTEDRGIFSKMEINRTSDPPSSGIWAFSVVIEMKTVSLGCEIRCFTVKCANLTYTLLGVYSNIYFGVHAFLHLTWDTGELVRDDAFA